jgi:hypothetical protein
MGYGNNVLSLTTSNNVGIGTDVPTQKLEVKDGGIRINTPDPVAVPRPTCSDTTRGTFWVTNGATDVKDTVEVCAKDAANAYAWRVLY